MKTYAEAKISRRTFLSGGALLSAGIVAAIAIPGAAEASIQQVKSKASDNKKEDGYRLTKHIADYYKSAAL